MLKYAFISRHQPTEAQVQLAKEKGIELVVVGDRDGFTINLQEFVMKFDGAIVVHPAAALVLNKYMPVGIFENANRAKEGEKPSFEAKAFHIFL